MVIKNKKLNFEKKDEILTFAESLKIKEGEAENNMIRVNKTVAQLCEKIHWFIIFLFLFYVLNLLEDTNPNHFLDSYDRGLVIIDFFQNVTNVISAAFLFFGFMILHDKTLDEENNTQSYYKETFLFLLIFISSYFFLLLLANNDLQRQIAITNHYNLACGICNGLAMFLLFGTLIFYKDIPVSNTMFSKKFFQNGAILILPIYAIANCLYGVQEFDEFPALEPLTFFICFIGKGFFLLFIYHYVTFRWLHIYMHINLAVKKNPRNILNLINRSRNNS